MKRSPTLPLMLAYVHAKVAYCNVSPLVIKVVGRIPRFVQAELEGMGYDVKRCKATRNLPLRVMCGSVPTA